MIQDDIAIIREALAQLEWFEDCAGSDDGAFDDADCALMRVKAALIEIRTNALEEAAHFTWQCVHGGKDISAMPDLIRGLINA